MFIDIMIMLVVLVMFVCAWIYGELQVHKIGGEVSPATVKLAMVLNGSK